MTFQVPALCSNLNLCIVPRTAGTCDLNNCFFMTCVLQTQEKQWSINRTILSQRGGFSVDFLTQAVACTAPQKKKDNVILRFEKYQWLFAGWDYSGQWRPRQLVQISVAETVAVSLRYAQATFITCLFVTNIGILSFLDGIRDTSSFAAEWPCRMHRNSTLTFRELAIAAAGRLKGVVGWLGKQFYLLWSDMKAQGCPAW